MGSLVGSAVDKSVALNYPGRGSRLLAGSAQRRMPVSAEGYFAAVRSYFALIWAFPQLRNIFLFVLGMGLLMPALVQFWVVPAFNRLLVVHTEEGVLLAATNLAHAVTGQVDRLDRETLRTSPEAIRLLQDGAIFLGGYKLRLFDAGGRIVHSTEAAEIGQINTGAVFSGIVARGKPFSKLEGKGEATTDGDLNVRSVVETYVPILREGRFIGAFEVYTDITERERLQNDLLRQSSLVLSSVVVGLLAFLVFVLARAGRALALKDAAEEKLRETATVFEVSSDAILITDTQGVIRRVNPAFTEMTGYTAAEAVNSTPRLLKSGRHGADFFESFWASLQQNGHWEGEVFNRNKDGSVYPRWEIVSALKEDDGKVAGYLAQYSDVARRKLTEDEIRYRANYDVLTGLPNRNLLVERLERAILEAERAVGQVAVLFVDLDNFKLVNDTQGHLAGDSLLQEAAAILRSCVRAMDTVARQGGDEFVVVLPGIDTRAHAADVAGKIVDRFREGLHLDGQPTHVTASVGVAVYPDDGGDVFTLFRNADLAMYRAKERGRNGLQFYEPVMTYMAVYRRAFEMDLRQALARNELFMHYQPILDMRTNDLVGVEALMRWRHPQRGLVAPDQFIPMAEETGLITEMGAWALSTVCEQLAAWRAQGLNLHAAVNLSGRQIPGGVGPDYLAALVARHGLKASDLLLEITEGVLLENVEKAQAWVDAVRALGFRVALDDFGTGYSSLTYLKRLNLDVVKIDKSFVRDMDANSSDHALVQTIVSLAHQLGLQVVAEGVENRRQFDLLKFMGCASAQGFLISRPLPPQGIPGFRYVAAKVCV